MLIKLFQHFNWRKFTLVYEDGSMRPIRTQLRYYVDSHPELRFVMKEQVYASPGSPGCDSHTKKCGNHVMAEIIRSTKDGTRSELQTSQSGKFESFVVCIQWLVLNKSKEEADDGNLMGPTSSRGVEGGGLIFSLNI